MHVTNGYIVLLLVVLRLFNGLYSRTTWVSEHQKGKPFWILLEQEMTGWQWRQLEWLFCSLTSKAEVGFTCIFGVSTVTR